MSFTIANRTDVIRGSDNREIGWVYTTETGERMAYYFASYPTVAGTAKTGSIMQAHAENTAA